jgi:cytochrome P450
VTKTIPRVAGLPVLGSRAAFNRDRLGFLLRVARECGEAGSFNLGPLRLLQFNTPALCQEALVDHMADFDQGDLYRMAFRPLMGDGILMSDGERHLRQRKLMAWAFQPKQVAAYAGAMVADARRLADRWDDGATIEIDREMEHLSMTTGGRTLFGVDVLREAERLGRAITACFDHIAYLLSASVPLPLWWPSARSRRTRGALAVANQEIQALIDARRASPEERDDFLSMLLRAQREDPALMTDELVRVNALTIFVGGFETMAKALTWSIYLLSTHPEVQERLRAEVDAALDGKPPGAADLPRLSYALQVFKEAMRLYPPAPAALKQAIRDVEIGGYAVPRKQLVFFLLYLGHRAPEHFPDPDRFDPDRFAPDAERAIPKGVYVPFGVGPHTCIGSHFALLQGALVLALLGQRLSFELAPGQRVEPELTHTLRPRHGLKAIVRRRR